MSEPHDAHLRGDAVWGGADEEEPLGHEVCDEDQIITIWDRLHELVPGEDEVGEYEEDCSEGEETAALQECKQQHDADQAGVDGHAGADDSVVGHRDYAGKDYCQQCHDAECDHEQIAFHLRCELLVTFDFREVSSRKIYYVHHVRERKAAHLSQEVAA